MIDPLVNTRSLGSDLLIVIVGSAVNGPAATDPVVAAVLDGITRAGDPTDPSTWPRRPLG